MYDHNCERMDRLLCSERPYNDEPRRSFLHSRIWVYSSFSTIRLWLSGRYCQKFPFEQVLIAHSERFISYHWQCIFGERLSTLFLPCRSVFLPVPHSNQHVSFGDLEVPLHGKPEAASLCRVNLMKTKQHVIVIIWPYLRHWWIPLTQM